MTAFGIEPAEGYVALEFLEPEIQTHERAKPVSSDESDAILALCVGVGSQVTVCQRGDTVKVRPYSRQGIKVGDNVVLVEAYCVIGKA